MRTRPPQSPWRSPSRLALWVALPMAQTPKIESRLRMLLDATRPRYALTRRARISMLALAFAALVPLAMLRPHTKARAASALANRPEQVPLSIQLLGITDATTSGGEWWSVDGRRLPGHPFDVPTLDWDGNTTKITVQPRQVGRFFAFHLPPALQNVPILWDFPDVTLSGLTTSLLVPPAIKESHWQSWNTRTMQIQLPHRLLVYGAAFPGNLSQTTVRAGVGSGPWKRAASVRLVERDQTYFMQNTSGAVCAVNVCALDRLDRRRTVQGYVALSSTSSYPLDFRVDISPTLGDTVDVRLIAVDLQGRQTMPVKTDRVNDRGTTRFIVTFARPLHRIKEVRVETRPFAWTEFKNVALRPSPLTQNDMERARS